MISGAVHLQAPAVLIDVNSEGSMIKRQSVVANARTLVCIDQYIWLLKPYYRIRNEDRSRTYTAQISMHNRHRHADIQVPWAIVSPVWGVVRPVGISWSPKHRYHFQSSIVILSPWRTRQQSRYHRTVRSTPACVQNWKRAHKTQKHSDASDVAKCELRAPAAMQGLSVKNENKVKMQSWVDTTV